MLLDIATLKRSFEMHLEVKEVSTRPSILNMQRVLTR